MRTRPRSRFVEVPVLVVVMALVVAACGGDGAAAQRIAASTGDPGASSAQPSAAGSMADPSPTTAPSAPPASSQPPVDVAAAFLASLSRGLSAQADLEGSVRIGALTMPVSGRSQISGPDSHQTVTIVNAGRPTVIETISVGGHSYAKRAELWYEQPATGKADLSAFFTAMASLTDMGAVTKDGRRLHRLAPPPGTTIPPSALGAIPAGATGATLAVEFYAEDDGTPAIITIDASWTQKVGKADQPASMHLDMILSSVGRPIAVEAPSPVWVAMSSKRLGYRMSRPSDWDVELARKSSGNDYLFGPGGDTVATARTSCRCTLNAVTTDLIRYERNHTKGFKVVSNNTARVGGLRARRIESRGTYPNGRSWNLTWIVVRGRSVFFFNYNSDAPLTPQDRSVAAAMIGTVVFK
jgi:DcrB